MIALLACVCDGACRREHAVETWRADPAAGAAEIAALDDPRLRTAAVVAVAEAFPGSSPALCAEAEAGLGRERCERLNARPHLRMPVARTEYGDPITGRSAPGPGTSALPLRSLRFTPETVADPCEADLDRGTCLEMASIAAAVAGSRERAAGLCRHFDDGRMRDECTFGAAETALGASGYTFAAPMCAASGAFEANCHAHLLHGGVVIAQGEPDGRLGAMRVADVWGVVDPMVATLYVDQYWARYFLMLATSGVQVDAAEYASAPLGLRPHIHAAVAWTVVRTADGTLADRVALVQATLAGTDEAVGHGPPEWMASSDLWPEDADDVDRATPSAYYLVGARRPVSADPEVDIAICVVEAAARLDAPDVELLREAVLHPDALVARDAARLLAGIEAKHARRERRAAQGG